MMGWKSLRKALVVVTCAFALAGCQIIPDARAPSMPPPPTTTTQTPPSDARTPPPIPRETPTPLPQDEQRHRIALLVPTSGDNARVGRSIADATTMALLDTNADNLRITTYDTSDGAAEAARRAIAEGNRLILGPLLGSNVSQVLEVARPAAVPLITFSNDTSVASPSVYLLGLSPRQSIGRTVAFANRQGAQNYAAMVPEGEYGRQAELALLEALRETGKSIVATERYTRNNSSIMSAARRLQTRGGFDTVLIADSPRLAIMAANELRAAGAAPRLLGTELWSGEGSIPGAESMQGALFSAVSDARFRRFSESYRERFDRAPFRISTLGYDAVLLALRVSANGWVPGTPFPTQQLLDQGGFLGLDGAFRFRADGIAERALEVREVREGQVTVVSPAPDAF